MSGATEMPMMGVERTNRDAAAEKTARTCVGCGEKDAPTAFVRLIQVPPSQGASSVVVDAARGSFGRGAHVHPRPDCIEKAAKGGLARAFKSKIDVQAAALAGDVATALERRVEGLLLAARRAGDLAVGTDAALASIKSGKNLLVVASDAGSIAESAEIERAVREGRAVAWGSKERLGALLGRGNDVALATVERPTIAEEILRACQGASACRAIARRETRAKSHVSEVR